MAGLGYRDAGVDIDAGERLVERIKPLAARTRTPEVLDGVGGFAGLYELPRDVTQPVLVSGTDGVGTKLEIANRMDVHDTVGIDLVAMCVNDVLTTGARPLFFLDYMVTDRLDVDRAEHVVAGIAEGCRRAGCALLGGETAEHPGVQAEGRYDLAGFAVGIVDRSRLLDGRETRAGDVVVALPSSGLHSNGFSLARKALLEHAGMSLDERPAPLDETLGETLLRPTRIYVSGIQAALTTGGVRASCHVTGGGLPGNVPRILPSGLAVTLDPSAWRRPPIFDVIQRAGGVPEAEMRKTFNLGVGFVAIVAAERAEDVMQALRDAGEDPRAIGEVRAARSGEHETVRFESP